jgi:hypothetical protein
MSVYKMGFYRNVSHGSCRRNEDAVDPPGLGNIVIKKTFCSDVESYINLN